MRLLAALAFALAILGCSENTPALASVDAPSLLLFVADDLGRGDVGYLGSSLSTPSIDRIANEGVALDHFYAAPLCSLTRAALLTGRPPAHLGLLSVIRPWEERGLAPEEQTLAELLRDEGYATALVGKWHLGHARRAFWPQQQGSDHFYGSLGGAIDHFTHERRGSVDWQRNGESLAEVGYSTELVANEARRWLGSVESDQPFFLAVSFHAPHPPRQAPEELLAKFGALPPKQRVYAAMVDALDSAIGSLLGQLERAGRADNTIVVFLSDNGAGDSEHTRGLRGDKGSTFDGGMRAPLAMRWPAGLPNRGHSQQRLRSEDLFATLADALGVAAKLGEGLDGESVWSELRAGTVRERDAFYFAADSKDARSRAVLDGAMKLVEIFDGVTWRGQLFDVVADPAERYDLSNERSEQRERLAAKLAHWYDGELGSPERLPAEPPDGWLPPANWTRAAKP